LNKSSDSKILLQATLTEARETKAKSCSFIIVCQCVYVTVDKVDARCERICQHTS